MEIEVTAFKKVSPLILGNKKKALYKKRFFIYNS
jgi:hypothetical protein